jgi:hypothetical protein
MLLVMKAARIFGHLSALGQAVITHHSSHPQPVVGKNTGSVFLLALAVFGMLSPVLYGLVIPPKGKR